jgi:hypothetical protein
LCGKAGLAKTRTGRTLAEFDLPGENAVDPFIKAGRNANRCVCVQLDQWPVFTYCVPGDGIIASRLGVCWHFSHGWGAVPEFRAKIAASTSSCNSCIPAISRGDLANVLFRAIAPSGRPPLSHILKPV